MTPLPDFSELGSRRGAYSLLFCLTLSFIRYPLSSLRRSRLPCARTTFFYTPGIVILVSLYCTLSGLWVLWPHCSTVSDFRSQFPSANSLSLPDLVVISPTLWWRLMVFAPNAAILLNIWGLFLTGESRGCSIQDMWREGLCGLYACLGLFPGIPGRGGGGELIRTCCYSSIVAWFGPTSNGEPRSLWLLADLLLAFLIGFKARFFLLAGINRLIGFPSILLDPGFRDSTSIGTTSTWSFAWGRRTFILSPILGEWGGIWRWVAVVARPWRDFLTWFGSVRFFGNEDRNSFGFWRSISRADPPSRSIWENSFSHRTLRLLESWEGSCALPIWLFKWSGLIYPWSECLEWCFRYTLFVSLLLYFAVGRDLLTLQNINMCWYGYLLVPARIHKQEKEEVSPLRFQMSIVDALQARIYLFVEVMLLEFLVREVIIHKVSNL